ncbi:MAG: hypothetical protein ACJ79G_17075, partial [Myxococcales bacterium]
NALRCWGGNESGQIDSSGLNRVTPTNVAPFGGQPSEQVIAGRAYTCAFRTPADVACFGDNSFGQQNFPLVSVASLAAGGDHTCIIDTTNEIRCFGRNASSELGPFGP